MLSMQKQPDATMVVPNARAALDADLHVGQKVRKARKAMDMSQTELGNLLGVSFQQVQKYEKGSNRIGSGRLWEISRVLRVPIDYFFDGIDDEVSSDTSVPWWLLDLAKQIEAIKDEKLQKQIISLIETCSDKK
ncbi:MAG: helix-turn-helix transcriptional regulator [Hyphomicrobiales bacterium]